MHPTEPVRFSFVTLCGNHACERRLSGPVIFCPYCGTKQLATMSAPGETTLQPPTLPGTARLSALDRPSSSSE